MVHIADAGSMSAAFIARVFCLKSEKHTTVTTRVDFRIAAPGGAGDHIGNAIPVGVTGRFNPVPSSSPAWPSAVQSNLPDFVEYT